MGKEIKKVKLQKTNVMHHELTEENSTVDLSRQALLSGGDQSLDKKYTGQLDKVRGGLHLSALKKSVAKNQYGETFKTILTKEERLKAEKKGTGEIGRKQKNRKQCLEASDEYEKRSEEAIKKFKKTSEYKSVTGGILAIEDESSFLVDENMLITACMNEEYSIDKKLFTGYYGDIRERFDALDSMLTDYINMDFDFDFSTDESFVAESQRLIQVKNKGEAIIALLMHNSDYWTSLPEETRAMLTEKSVQSSALLKYYEARKKVIVNNQYVRHLDAELSFSSDAPMHLLTLQNDMWMAERAYEELLLVGTDSSQEEIELNAINIVEGRGLIQAHRPSMGVMKDMEKKSEGLNSSWLDIFGYPLKAMSRLMRDKRTNEHGRKRFDYSKGLFKLFPESLAKIDDEADDDVLLGKHEKKRDGAPPIKLGKYFNDPLKNALSREIESGTPAALFEFAKKKRELEPIAAHLKDFIDTARMYASVKGIVNADTAEMEMAFIDKLQEIRDFVAGEALLDNAEDIMPYLSFMNLCLDPILEMGRGKLRTLMTDNQFNELNENLTAIIQDTGDDMAESNIKDIPLFTHVPNINDVKQSTIGDCYLVAAMTSLVAADPDAILSMFYDIGDGNVLVKLFDGEPLHPVYFKLRKHYETGEGNASDCVWPQLIEKAYAAGGFNKKGVAKVDKNGYLTGMERELTSGCAEEALSHLSGTRLVSRDAHKNIDREAAAQKEREILHANNEHHDGDDYWIALTKGMPLYMSRRLFIENADSDKKEMSIRSMEDHIKNSCRAICDDIGTILMQYKKVCLRNNLPYKETIEAFAAKTGLPLSQGWDENQRAYYRLMDSEEIREEDFDINKDFQRWPNLFDMDRIIKDYTKILNTNLDNLLYKRPITASAGDLELRIFGDVNMNEAANNLLHFAKAAASVKASETIVQDSLHLIETQFAVDEQERMGLALREAQLTEMDPEMASDYSKVAYLQKYRIDIVRDLDSRVFLRSLAETLKDGGAMAISINHFISAVDMDIFDGKWFVLIKDPFNVYNRTYEKTGFEFGNPIVEADGHDDFWDVIDIEGRKIKRHLDAAGDEKNNYYGGFRGLSWWSIEDLMKVMKSYVPMSGQQIKKTVV